MIINPGINLGIKLLIMDSPVTTLSKLLRRVISELYGHKYVTGESLQTILIEINKLPIECLTGDNELYVNRTIKSIGYFNGLGKLTDKQMYGLAEAIKYTCDQIDGKGQQAHNPIISHETYSTNITKQMYDSAYSTNITQQMYDSNVIKLTADNDDVICQVIFAFIIDLSRDVMTSTLNVIVINYFETIELLLLENRKRYSAITNEISSCLGKHGWKNGFTKEPKIKDMLTDLQNIADKYF